MHTKKKHGIDAISSKSQQGLIGQPTKQLEEHNWKMFWDTET